MTDSLKWPDSAGKGEGFSDILVECYDL